MKILFVCHRFPFPPNRGGKIRPFNIIRHLSRDHEVTVASLARTPEEAEAGRGLGEHCHEFLVEVIPTGVAWLRMLGRLPTSIPSSFGYFHSPRLARRIRRKIAEKDFDLIFVHCSSAARYVEWPAGIPKIMDFGDMDSQKWLTYGEVKPFPLSLGYRLEGMKLQAEERRLARIFDLCTCTTRAELDTLQAYGSGTPCDWFPNGVDLEVFEPTDRPYDPDHVCFVGRMDYFPNQQCMLDFCGEVWPRIRAARAGARLSIVGANPSGAISRLGELPGVTVTGTVPDVRPHVQSAALTVAPLSIARGTQNKILESLAMGVPVVASTSAAGGVGLEPGREFLVADGEAALAKAVLRLMGDPEERRRLSLAGRAGIEAKHSWAASLRRLDGIVERCLAGQAEGGDPAARREAS